MLIKFLTVLTFAGLGLSYYDEKSQSRQKILEPGKEGQRFFFVDPKAVEIAKYHGGILKAT